MKQIKYILFLISAFCITACSEEDEYAERDVQFCIRAAWQNGLNNGPSSRALSATDILALGTNDINIDYQDYPAEINVKCSDGKSFILNKGAVDCSEHSGFWHYSPTEFYKDNVIKRDNLKFTATATIDDGDELTGEADVDNLVGNHLQFTLHHTKALIRFAFRVDEKYDKIRKIKITSVRLNGEPTIYPVEKVLSTDNQVICYIYVDPKDIDVYTSLTLSCTYNVYDNDEVSDEHNTRKEVTNTNTFTFNKIKNSGGNVVSTIKAGYYYDLFVTINPDYLYTLSNHDNKSALSIK